MTCSLGCCTKLQKLEVAIMLKINEIESKGEHENNPFYDFLQSLVVLK